MEMIIDACTIMAVIVNEPERDSIINLTKNAILISPNIVIYEIANALTRMMRKKVIERERMLNAYAYFQKIPIKMVDINILKALEIAWDNNIYAYDACYLESAKRLNLPLFTFDGNMIKIGKKMGLEILGEKNDSI